MSEKAVKLYTDSDPTPIFVTPAALTKVRSKVLEDCGEMELLDQDLAVTILIEAWVPG